MKFKLVLIILVFVLLINGCVKNISEIKNEEYIGKTVSIRGTVENTLKIGELSTYRLIDNDGTSISVASKSLPEEGDKITVKGTVERTLLLGYYIKAD